MHTHTNTHMYTHMISFFFLSTDRTLVTSYGFQVYWYPPPNPESKDACTHLGKQKYRLGTFNIMQTKVLDGRVSSIILNELITHTDTTHTHRHTHTCTCTQTHTHTHSLSFSLPWWVGVCGFVHMCLCLLLCVDSVQDNKGLIVSGTSDVLEYIPTVLEEAGACQYFINVSTDKKIFF